MDTTALEAAYRRLLELARDGGFRPPSDRAAWSAERILAHVAANDRLLAATTAALLAGGSPSYDNLAATSEAWLDEIGRAADDLAGLVATVRQGGLELVMLVRRLDDTRGASVVPTRIVDGDTVRVDGPMPWSGVLNTHAEVHLPSHVEQLTALR